MKFIEYEKLSSKDKLNKFINSLSITNRTFDYYVNWEKIYNNIKEIELGLHTLNYLIGKDDIHIESKKLFTNQPYLIKLIPLLIATREKELNILNISDKLILKYKKLDFENIDLKNIDNYIEFAEKT